MSLDGIDADKKSLEEFYVMSSLDLIDDISTINKFGAATDCDNGVATDIWDGADGTTSTDVWVPPTIARVHDIASGSANDTSAGTGARTVEIFGLQTWGSVETSEIITMNGTTNVATSNSYVIIHRMKVLTWGSGGVNAGIITATAQTDSTVTSAILTGNNQTQMCIYGVPSSQKLRVTEFGCEVVKSSASTILAEGEVLIMIDPNTNVGNNNAWTNVESFISKSDVTKWKHQYKVPKKFDGPCIVKLQVTADTDNTTIMGYFDGVLFTP